MLFFLILFFKLHIIVHLAIQFRRQTLEFPRGKEQRPSFPPKKLLNKPFLLANRSVGHRCDLLSSGVKKRQLQALDISVSSCISNNNFFPCGVSSGRAAQHLLQLWLLLLPVCLLTDFKCLTQAQALQHVELHKSWIRRVLFS